MAPIHIIARNTTNTKIINFMKTFLSKIPDCYILFLINYNFTLTYIQHDFTYFQYDKYYLLQLIVSRKLSFSYLCLRCLWKTFFFSKIASDAYDGSDSIPKVTNM